MSGTKNWRLAVLAVTVVLLVAACGEKDPLAGTPVKEAVTCTPVSVDRSDNDPVIEKVAKVAKLASKDLVKGKGCPVDYAQFQSFDLKGATAVDGKVFFDTWGTDRPFVVSIGSGTLLPSLESKLQGMKVGGRRMVSIPAVDAYGVGGSPEQGIGPNQDVIFVAELVEVASIQDQCNQNFGIPKGTVEGKPTKVDMPLTIGDKVVTKDLTVGTGAVAEKGKAVVAHYLLLTCNKGTQEESSWDSGDPFTIDSLGEGTIPGFATGIEGMKVGGVRQIEVPAALAYGAAPDPQNPLGGQDLVFIVKVLDVKAAITTTVPAATPTPTLDPTATTAPSPDSKTPDSTTTTAG